MDKRVVRAHTLDKRRKITFKRRNAKSLKIMEQLLELLEGHKNIGIYLSLKDEVNTTDYLDHFFENFESVSTSVIEDEQLVFYKIKSIRELKPGYMGVLQPPTTDLTLKDEMDVIIVPVVGFDRQNNRIGYGKGFYDRYLSDYKHKTIGLAFDEQEYRHIPHDENDVALDYIVTETRIFKK
ncbi:MAG: 5-formyltetrahydrofolate cyclo-ligase [Erysipelothrix sp.]|nr:5-formyltetrahydrofolate cyclo-ligase [Erysipelothrix sp.]